MTYEDAPGNDQFLTVAEAADASGFQAAHINRMIKEGHIEATKKDGGNRWQIKKSALDSYMASNLVKPARSKEYLARDTPGQPPKSLLTQLEEKDRTIMLLKEELATAEIQIDDLKSTHAEKVSELELTIDHQKIQTVCDQERLQDLEADNRELRAEIKEHNEFIRTSFKEFIQSFLSTTPRDV